MDNWFKSKWFVRFAALAFAIVLYIFVETTVNSSTTESAIPGTNTETQTLDDVPVEIRIDSEKYVVSGVPEYVTVSLEGPPNYLRPIVLQRNFDVYVDLVGLEEGEHTVEIEYNVSNQLEAYIEPKTVDVFIEEKASQEFDVSVDFINQDKLPAGYEVGDFELDPSTVTISSSKSIIDRIGVVKVFVDVAELKESIDNREVPINVYDAQGNELSTTPSPERVKVSAEINNPSKTVSLNVPTTGELPEGYSLMSISANVEEVEIFAKSNILADINSISTEEIDLSEVEETGVVEVGLSLPDGVQAPDVETVEVTLEVEHAKTLEKMPIEVDGLEEGQDVTFIEPSDEATNVTLVGNEKQVGALTKENVRVFIDAVGVESGKHTLPIEVEVDSESENVSASTGLEEVTINVN
ncbi:CdaR family protein [Oceanobacillus senegalensis]|uniref:CdaR family protein n=1 Tax=Oceanobacillus senegalensis TaxID=1936063 RepID=UPI000A30D038|nr:CdaR family protein [Oceanobacillus senegalensis]